MPSSEGGGGILELEKGSGSESSDRGSGAAIYLDTALWAVQQLRPTFLTKSSSRPQRLRRTAYLDGIRGFAALMVYWVHHELWAHEALDAERRIQSSWGYRGEHWFVTFPFIRTFFSGSHLAVGIFFILSGYVLSTKPLALVYSGDHAELAAALASGIFRRWFRLYLPIIFVTFLIISCYHWTGILVAYVPESSWRDEFWKWYMELKTYTFLYGQPKVPWFTYHPHTWTIPVEFKGSIFVWINILALSRSTRKARLACIGFMMFYCMYIVDGAYYTLFLTGLLLCDLDLHDSPEYWPDWMNALSPYSTGIAHVLLVIGLWLGGCPAWISEIDYLRQNPGWVRLAALKPKAVYDYKWFFLFWAALCIVLAIQRIGYLKRFFETRFCMYLGRISYMLYLVHGPILWTLGDRVYAATGWSREAHALVLPRWANRFPLPKWGPFGLEVGFLLPQLVLLPITFWVADLGTTFIDGPAIKLGTWLYKSTLAAPSKQAGPPK
ncbi:hypothetical protein K461DRAFT_218644 [Myriangium duriaei CBS 260.36]|uniref:Acyltransferase 3 domain-containing protein n=1 Tax=Myriangium duriaei CBS 260.36 TaxID=1168546 RepID=A0A9P4J9N9_9PEZI|nr:hypothetical protein K461DRAFT_218644 [Myriangium duriaei CBS 260.36]